MMHGRNRLLLENRTASLGKVFVTMGVKGMNYIFSPGDPMFRRDRSVSEDRSVRQESWAHTGLCVPPA